MILALLCLLMRSEKLNLRIEEDYIKTVRGIGYIANALIMQQFHLKIEAFNYILLQLY
jgi:hypothetical protein